jgi:hypothetical protein
MHCDLTKSDLDEALALFPYPLSLTPSRVLRYFSERRTLIGKGLLLMSQTTSWRASQVILAVILAGWVAGAGAAQTPTPPAKTPAPATAPAPAPGATAAPKPEGLEPPDKVVLKVGDQQFTKADMDRLIASLPPQAQQALAARGKKALGDQYAVMVMLSQQAHLHHLDQTPAFAQKLAFQKQQLEAQAAFEEINQQATPTPQEVQQYYAAHAADYDEITARQIIIRKKPPEPKPDPSHPADSAHPAPTGPGLAPDAAKAAVEAVRKELLAGTDIKKIMAEYPPGTVTIDAAPQQFRRGRGMRPEIDKVAFALKDGEISDPVDLPSVLLFVQVISHSHADLKTVTPEIERALRQEKVQAAMDVVKKNSNMWMDDQYFAPSQHP